MRSYHAALLCVLSLVPFTCGCLSSAQIRANELQAKFAGMYGQHKDEFIRKFGAPSACTPISSGEVCEWYNNLGQRGGSTSFPVTNLYTGKVTGMITDTDTYQAYEYFKIEFDSANRAINGDWKVRD